MKYSFLNEGLPSDFEMNKKWPYTSRLIDDITNDTIKQNSQPDSIMEEFKKTGKFDVRKLASGSSTGTPLIIIDDEVKGTNPEIMNKMDQTTIRSIQTFPNNPLAPKAYPNIAGNTPKQTKSQRESICIPNFCASSDRFMALAILPSNISQIPQIIRQIMAVL